MNVWSVLDPHNADTDGDGLPDGWEVRRGVNPLVPNNNGPGADPDGDGLSNAEEALLTTDPLVPTIHIDHAINLTSSNGVSFGSVTNGRVYLNSYAGSGLHIQLLSAVRIRSEHSTNVSNSHSGQT